MKADAVLRQKDHEIENLREENERYREEVYGLKQQIIDLKAAEVRKQMGDLDDRELCRHIELLEAALIGAGQEMGVDAIRRMMGSEERT